MERDLAHLHRSILDACATLQSLRRPELHGDWVREAEASAFGLALALDHCADCPEARELADDARELLNDLDAQIARTHQPALAQAS